MEAGWLLPPRCAVQFFNHFASASSNCDTRVLFSADRKRALIEVVAGYAGIVLALWTSGTTQKFFIAIVLLWVATCVAGTWRDLRECGLGVSGLRESAWVVFVALGVAATLVVTAARLHTLHVVIHGRNPAVSIAAYTVWALLQEFILINVFLARLLRILRSRVAAVMTTALLFGVAHIPNPLLVAVTLLWGAIACLLFLRYRNLYTLAIAHAIVGLTLSITIPDAVQHQMRVGIGYLHWHAPAVAASSKPQ